MADAEGGRNVINVHTRRLEESLTGDHKRRTINTRALSCLSSLITSMYFNVHFKIIPPAPSQLLSAARSASQARHRFRYGHATMMKHMLASQTRETRLSEKVSESESVRREGSSAIPFLSLLIKSAAFARYVRVASVSPRYPLKFISRSHPRRATVLPRRLKISGLPVAPLDFPTGALTSFGSRASLACLRTGRGYKGNPARDVGFYLNSNRGKRILKEPSATARRRGPRLKYSLALALK